MALFSASSNGLIWVEALALGLPLVLGGGSTAGFEAFLPIICLNFFKA